MKPIRRSRAENTNLIEQLIAINPTTTEVQGHPHRQEINDGLSQIGVVDHAAEMKSSLEVCALKTNPLTLDGALRRRQQLVQKLT